MTKQHKVLILGYGKMGHAMEYPLFQLIQEVVACPENVSDRIQDYLTRVYG